MDQKARNALDSLCQPMALANEKRLFRALFYGDPGTGKTSLVFKCIEQLGGSTALLTTDSAWTVLFNDEFDGIRDSIDRYPFAGFSQIKTMLEAREEGIEPYASYNNMVLDTVSTSVDSVMRYLVDTVKDQKVKAQQPHDLVEGWPHYRITERALRDTVNLLNKTDMNIIYTAHIREPNENDRAKKRFAIRPNMPQASYNVVSQEVSLIGWLHVEKGKYLIQTQPTLTETAKSQIPTIPQAILETDQIPALVQKWTNR